MINKYFKERACYPWDDQVTTGLKILCCCCFRNMLLITKYLLCIIIMSVLTHLCHRKKDTSVIKSVPINILSVTVTSSGRSGFLYLRNIILLINSREFCCCNYQIIGFIYIASDKPIRFQQHCFNSLDNAQGKYHREKLI